MKWFRNLKTSVKLISSFTLLAIVALIVGLFAIINMNSLSNNMDNLYTNQLKPIEFLLQATTSTSETKNHVRASLLATDSTQQSNYVSQVNSDLKSMDTNLNQYSKTHLSADEQKVYDGVPADVQNFKDAVDNIESLMQAGDKQQAIKQLTTSLSPAENKLSDALNKLATINHNNAKQANADGKSLSASSRNIMIIIIAAAILIALALGFLISHLIANPLKRISDLVSKVSKGDLRETTDIDSKDEVGQLAKSVNSMVLQLREVINGILGSSENLLASSQEISAATEQVASGSTSQAQASETVNQLFKELSDAITSVAQNAEEAAGLSSQTTDLAKKGETIVQSSVEGMNNVNDHMVRLSDDSNRVGEIVEVIDDIADQTNLLALNAAIEAARAGDQGRGFAVVADEVRKLAERTSEATKQIGAIIKTMQENMTTSVQSVSEGVALTENSGAAFKDIVGMVNNTATKVSEIAAAGEEQSAQASEVLVAVESIATAAEEAAASSEETASSSQTLARLAQDLQEYVAVFKVN